jgi:hypothetical protein
MRPLAPIAAAALLIGGAEASTAASMRPLIDVLAEEQSEPIFFFALKRCAAVYIPVQALFELSEKADDRSMAATASELSASFFTAAKMWNEATNQGSSDTRIFEDIMEMSTLYVEVMKANYFATGNRLEGVVASDMTTCKALFD